MAKATQLPSGRWRCKAYYTENGAYKSKSFTADTKREAEYAASAWLMEWEHSQKPMHKTLGQLADAYIESRAQLLSPTTITGYKKIRRTALQSIIDVRVEKLTKILYQKAISDYTVCIKADGTVKKRSPKTVIEAHHFFMTVLKTHGFTTFTDITLPERDRDEIKIPSTAEVKAFLEAIKGTDAYIYVKMAVVLGLRKSEIVGLQWRDIDTEAQRVYITRARIKTGDHTYVCKPTKTRSGTRDLHIPVSLIDELGEPGEPTEYICTRSPDALDSLYKRLRKKHGFEYHFHALRHYHASVLISQGIPDIYAKKRMGHATTTMLKRVYQHVLKETEEHFEQVIDQAFE